MGGTLNLDGVTLTLDGGTRPPASPLQFKYWSYRFQDIAALNYKFFSYFTVDVCQYCDRSLTFGKLAYIYWKAANLQCWAPQVFFKFSDRNSATEFQFS